MSRRTTASPLAACSIAASADAASPPRRRSRSRRTATSIPTSTTDARRRKAFAPNPLSEKKRCQPSFPMPSKPIRLARTGRRSFKAMADKDEQEAIQSSAAASQAMRDEIAAIADKLQRLHAALFGRGHRARAVSRGEGRPSLPQEVVGGENGRTAKGTVAWLEPLRGWIKDAENLRETALTLLSPPKNLSAQKILRLEPLS